jgi:hypothetical protein
VLRAAREVVAQPAAEGRRIALAAEWLLDNFYLVEQQIVLARRQCTFGNPLREYLISGRIDSKSQAAFVRHGHCWLE